LQIALSKWREFWRGLDQIADCRLQGLWAGEFSVTLKFAGRFQNADFRHPRGLFMREETQSDSRLQIADFRTLGGEIAREGGRMQITG
jgi:hypothetical protein